MKRRKPSVWVLVHCEFMGTAACTFVDSLVWHASSTRRKAEAYVRGRGVSPWSWWELRRFFIDCDDPHLDDLAQVREVRHFSYRGTPLPAPPLQRSRRAWDKELAKRKKEGY